MQEQKNIEVKICRECGSEIQERSESTLYECERCMGNYEE